MTLERYTNKSYESLSMVEEKEEEEEEDGKMYVKDHVRLKSRSPYRDGGPRSRSRSDPADSEGEPSRATSNFSPVSIAKTFSISSSSSGPVSAP